MIYDIIYCMSITAVLFLALQAGTADRDLIRIIVTRCEVDMVQIKQEFNRLYNKSLESYISVRLFSYPCMESIAQSSPPHPSHKVFRSFVYLLFFLLTLISTVLTVDVSFYFYLFYYYYFIFISFFRNNASSSRYVCSAACIIVYM